MISCYVEDEMMKYEVMQLCDVLGAVFVEEATDRLTYVITDGSNREALQKLEEDGMHIVSIEWLRECLMKKELVPSEIYSLY